MINLYGSNGLISPFYKNVVEAVFDNTHKFITLKGGRFSAKGDTVYTLMLITLSQKQGESRIYVPIQRTIKTTVLKQVVKVIKRIGIDCKVNMSDYSITLNNGSKVYFNGLDANKSTVNTDLSKGGDSDLENGIMFCIFDEIGALAEFDRIDDIIDTFLRQPNCKFIEISNPPQNKTSKLIKRYSEQDNNPLYLVIHSTVYDIPKQWVNPTQVDKINDYKKNNKTRYRHSILGESVGVDGLAFDLTENIWTSLSNQYINFYIQTDEATANATTFSLFGINEKGQIHYITNYYYSSKLTGLKKSPSQFANDFNDWYISNGIKVESIVTDGLAFAVELNNLGFKAKSIGKLKDRVKSYQLLDKIVKEENFKIVDRPENIMLYEQMSNAEVEYNKHDQPLISKKKESSTNDDTQHTHALDTCLYICLRLQKQILRGQNGRF